MKVFIFLCGIFLSSYSLGQSQEPHETAPGGVVSSAPLSCQGIGEKVLKSLNFSSFAKSPDFSKVKAKDVESLQRVSIEVVKKYYHDNCPAFESSQAQYKVSDFVNKVADTCTQKCMDTKISSDKDDAKFEAQELCSTVCLQSQEGQVFADFLKIGEPVSNASDNPHTGDYGFPGRGATEPGFPGPVKSNLNNPPIGSTSERHE